MFFFSRSVEFVVYKRSFLLRNLMILKRRIDGRNSTGSLVFYNRGGGSRRFYRFVDYYRFFFNIPAIVRRFEYDPNRNAYIALLCYINGFLSYIIAPVNLCVGTFVVSGIRVPLTVGNHMVLAYYPIGSLVYNVSIRVNSRSSIARAAGTSVQILKKVANYMILRLPSKEERLFDSFCTATSGVVANDLQRFKYFTKASDSVWLGHKPRVRGVAKNPIDHPHGGGEGRTTSGRPSITPWGIYTKGVRTSKRFARYEGSNRWRIMRRRRNKLSDSYDDGF